MCNQLDDPENGKLFTIDSFQVGSAARYSMGVMIWVQTRDNSCCFRVYCCFSAQVSDFCQYSLCAVDSASTD